MPSWNGQDNFIIIIIIIIIIISSSSSSSMSLHLAHTNYLSKNRRGLKILDSQSGTPNLEYLRFETDQHVLKG
jgi:uncharacterized protein YpmB